MGETKQNIELSEKHQALREATEKALKKVSKKLIAETKEIEQLSRGFG